MQRVFSRRPVAMDVVLGAVAIILILLVVITFDRNSAARSTVAEWSLASLVRNFDSHSLPPTREPARASIQRGVDEYCHAVTTFESSTTFKDWAAFDEKENAKGINEDRVLEKVSKWSPKASADLFDDDEDDENDEAVITLKRAPKKKRPILLCIIITVFNDEMAVAAEQAWARKCDLYYFSSNKTDVKGNISRVFLISPAENPNKNAWQRLRLTLKHVASRLQGRFDHVLVVTDDSHIVVENLRHMLQEPYVAGLHKLGVPLFMGHRMVAHGSNTIFVSSSAILLNSVAMQLFSVMSEHSRCEPATFSEQDDLTLAACFAHFGIFPLNTQDPFGADRVHLFDHRGLTELIVDPKSSWWFPLYRRRPMPTGLDGVSARSWAFHYIDVAAQASFAKKITSRF